MRVNTHSSQKLPKFIEYTIFFVCAIWFLFMVLIDCILGRIKELRSRGVCGLDEENARGGSRSQPRSPPTPDKPRTHWRG